MTFKLNTEEAYNAFQNLGKMVAAEILANKEESFVSVTVTDENDIFFSIDGNTGVLILNNGTIEYK